VSASATPAAGLAERYGVLLDVGRTLTGTLDLSSLYREIHEQAARVLHADGFYISVHDPERDEARIVYFADQGERQECDVSYRGSESVVIAEGKSVLVEDRLSDASVMLLGADGSRVTRSAISAPLLHDGEVLGAISAQSYRASAYSPADLELLEGVADIAAVALMNAYHVADLRHRALEAERISGIGRAIAASLDPSDVLQRVAEAVRELMDADGASVWLLESDIAQVAAAAGSISLPRGLAWDLSGGELREKLIVRRGFAWIDDLAQSPLVPEHLRDQLQAGSGLAVPLIVDDGVAGFLTAGSRNTGAFGENHARILGTLADQAAVALHNARLHDSVRRLSLTDQLTGVANRRHFDIHLERELAAGRRGRSVALVIFDLDDFKKYNDAEGHLAGDAILRAFAGVLQDHNRAMNLVARLGGDEFVCVLTESHPEGVATFLDRIRAGLAADPLLGPSGVTVSTGVAFFDPESMRTGDDLIQRADDDLFGQKTSRTSR
jgi:diguanylate cyclase (GGDEF)-like protein